MKKIIPLVLIIALLYKFVRFCLEPDIKLEMNTRKH